MGQEWWWRSGGVCGVLPISDCSPSLVASLTYSSGTVSPDQQAQKYISISVSISSVFSIPFPSMIIPFIIFLNGLQSFERVHLTKLHILGEHPLQLCTSFLLLQNRVIYLPDKNHYQKVDNIKTAQTRAVVLMSISKNVS